MNKSIYLDVKRCVGCGACVVACMDQNDIYPEKGQPTNRRIYQIEDSSTQNIEICYFSLACQHCEDSPCMMACPTGAICKDAATGSVAVNKSLCIGCHSCALACPFGVPMYDSEGKLQKCGLCSERVEVGLEPACVRVCPQGALIFDNINNVQALKETATANNIVRSIRKASAP